MRAFAGKVVLTLGLCAALCACPGKSTPADNETLYVRDISAGIHDTVPIRGGVRPLRMRVEEDEFECSMCHEGFAGDQGQAALEGAHASITFDHGRNLLCLNCHHPENSDAYVDFGGEEIPSDQPTMLCAKCHGPHYREWLHDVHGRVNGAWDADFGEQTKLACIQCHDPHRPRFPEMRPQPPPVLTRFSHAAEGAHTDDESDEH